MFIYDHLYTFFGELFATESDLLEFEILQINFGGSYTKSITLAEWLSHTFSIITIALIFVFLIKFCIWLFKLFGGLFKW